MKGKKKTHEQFEKEVEQKGGGEYQLLSTYVNTNTKVLMKHRTCGYEYQVIAYSFLTGRRCPKCGKTQRKTHDTFVSEVFDLEGKDYIVLTPYINNKKPVLIKHVTCGIEYQATPSHFLSGRKRCPNCSLKNRNKNPSKFEKEFNQIANGEYELLSTYKKTNEKVLVRHSVCGNEYKVTPYHFLSGSKCPHCSGRIPKKHEAFKKEVFSSTDGEYELISEYKNSRSKVSVRHNACGHEYQVRANHFSAGTRCPKCRSSKGEQRIKTFLDKLGVSFTQEFAIGECRNKKPLRFDFMIQKEDGGIACFIEFDGIQHYKESAYFGGRDGYLNRIKNDRIKSNYAKEQEIPLLRIRYNQKNPEKLIRAIFENMKIKKKSGMKGGVSHEHKLIS